MMIGNPTLTPAAANPYVGPRRFEQEESKFFFGRDEEIKILSGLVVAHQLSLFYAQSGAGKSSLLRAGLLPRLTRKTQVGSGDNVYLYQSMEVLPIVTVGRGVPPSTREPIRNIFSFSAQLTLLPSADPNDLAVLPLVDALDILLNDGIPAGALWEPAQERNGRVRPPLIKPDTRLLIFDQFEELFTVYPERWREREAFFRQVDDALRQFPTLHILFTMREDYLAGLTPYGNLLPDDLRHRYRMERLRQVGALLAVTQPARAAEPSRTFAQGVAEELVKNLQRMQRSQRSQRLAQEQVLTTADAGATIPQDDYGEYIEPVHLQIVCQDLWASLTADRTEIQGSDLHSFGDVDQALTKFYESTITRVVTEIGISERTLRRWFTEELITPARTKALVYRDDERGETAGLPNTAVDILQNAWLIRGDMRGGDVWYELAHDRLVEPIWEANRLRQTPLALDAQSWLDANRNPDKLYDGQQLHDVAAELKEHLERFSELERNFVEAGLERERKRSDRRQQVMTIGAIIIILLLATLSTTTYNSSVSAKRSEATALAAQGTADALRLESLATATVAIANATAAISAKESSDEQRIKAELARSAAITAQERAITARTVAEQQRQVAQTNQLAADSIVSFGLNNQLDRSLLLAVEAMAVGLTINNQRSSAAEEALRQALSRADADPILVNTGDISIQTVSFRADGRSLLLWQANQLIQSSELDESNAAVTFTAIVTQNVPFAKISPKGHWLVLFKPGEVAQVHLLDLTKPDALPFALHSNQTITPTIAFSTDEQWLVFGGALIEVWDLTNPKTTPTFTREIGSPPATVAISNAGRWLAAASQSAFIRLWDLRSNAEPVLLNGHEALARTMLITPEQAWLISGSDDHTIRFWPLPGNVQPAIILRGHEDAVTALAISPDGSRLATGSADQSLRIWDLHNLAEKPLVLRGHTAGVREIGFSADRRWIFSIDQTNQLLLWRDQIDALIHLACLKAARNLTAQEWREFMSEPAYRQTCPDLPEPAIQMRYSNRDVIYAFWAAGRELNIDAWELLQSANLFHLLFQYRKPYTGPNIADLSGLTLEQQEVVRRKLLHESSQMLSTNTYLWRKPELLTIPLEPPPAEQLKIPADSSSMARVADLWNRNGNLLAAIAMDLEIDLDATVAWLIVESGGTNAGPDGRIIIRFENHIFYQEWGETHPDLFADHFQFNPDTPWQDHLWRADPEQPWQSFHGAQASEWQVYEFARSLDDTAAKRSISVGVAQIMGFQHQRIGFQSVQDMFAVVTSSNVGERIAFFLAFDLMNSDSTAKFLAAMRQRDFMSVATLYNGAGQASIYAELLQRYADAFNQLRSAQLPLFAVGDRVRATVALDLWDAADPPKPQERNIITQLPVGAEAIVSDGPTQVNQQLWWQLEWVDETAQAVKGWFAQSDAAGLPQLEVVLPAPQPQPTPTITPNVEVVNVSNLTDAADFVITTGDVSVWPDPGSILTPPSKQPLGMFNTGVILVILEKLLRANNITWWRVGGITANGELVGWIPGTFTDGKATIALPPKLPGTNIPDKATNTYLGAPFALAYGISQLFGENAAVYSKIAYDGVPLKGRNGVDFMTPLGTSILAVDVGTVLRAENDSVLGNFVLLQHSWGESLYAQLDTLVIAPGHQVKLGQTIGQSGNSGFSFGPHLGFAIRINPYQRTDGWGGFSNPLPYLNPKFVKLPSYITGN